MKKSFMYYALGWLVLLGLFNLIVFISPGWATLEKYTASFWIGYASVTVAYIVQLICAWTVFKKDAPKKTFYNISLFKVSYAGLIATFVVALICMVVTPLPYWIAAIGCSCVLVFSIIAVLKAKVAVNAVESVDEKIQSATSFILVMRGESETLIARAKSDDVKAICKKVRDAFKYSDPMSKADLVSVEVEIETHFDLLKNAIADGNMDDVTSESDELLALISERNNMCKRMK